MRAPTGAEFTDFYELLGVGFGAERDAIRRAFRARLLEVHPDKSAEPTDVRLLAQVMRAWEVLGDDELREEYDRVWRLRRRGEEPESASKLPHITASVRPQDQARSILYLLLEERGGEALERLRGLGDGAADFLAEHLDSDQFIDAAFLIAELFESKRSWFESLEWLECLIRTERTRRRHRPCYPEALDRARRLLIRRTAAELEPRVTLEYLRRAEILGLDRAQRVEVAKRRAQCYFDLGMRVEAARQVRTALDLQPGAKGLGKLRSELSDELDEGSGERRGAGSE